MIKVDHRTRRAGLGDTFLTDGEIIRIALDTDKTIAQDAFQTVMYPETYIIAPDSTVRRKIARITDWTSPDMAAFLDTLK